MNAFTQSTNIMGVVQQVDADNASFSLRCRSKDEFDVFVSSQTVFEILQNLDGLSRDRVAAEAQVPDQRMTPAQERTAKYVKSGALLVVEGIYLEYGGTRRFEARRIVLMHWKAGAFLFEETHWWLTQISRLGDRWLENLFGVVRSYTLEDFSRSYRTGTNILGGVTDDNIQECATLSRLIYGLSSAYLLTGSERFFLAARAGVQYQRETFRSVSHDGKYVFWAFGKRRLPSGDRLIMASENPDDYGTIPLYEQIYALAGLAQYYRITQDWDVLDDIRRTVASFNDYYLDDEKAKARAGFPGHGSYFSHIDFVTMRPDSPALGDNCLRKNWNSVGDHIPAYLINLVLALDPLPQTPTGGSRESVTELRETAIRMLEETATTILKRLPDPGRIPYVNERFHADWTEDHSWRWQQNRAVIGHNLKIAWNLSRCANYFEGVRDQYRTRNDTEKAAHFEDLTHRFRLLASKLGESMIEAGIDQIRGGCFDAVERVPQNGLPIEFSWGNTKDFWQQEQAILAYLILHGADPKEELFRDLARESAAFWNCYFLDRDRRNIYFRVTDTGSPVIQGAYADKGSHSISGYHAFELNYLAHLYTRAFFAEPHRADNPHRTDSNFCLFFRPSPESALRSINVLPDFFPPGLLEIASISINGQPRRSFSPSQFQIDLDASELGCELRVEFRRVH
jgi:hypothetical protein